MEKFHEPYIPEKQLIEELKPILKQHGYLKNRKHWRKQLNEVFALRFCVQTSMYDHNNYDVRVGVHVKIPWIEEDTTPYGHFFTNIFVSSGLQVYNDSIEYFKQWTDWKVLRGKMFLLKEWREQNPPKYLQSLPSEKRVKPPCQVPFGEPAVVEYVTSDEFKETCERLIGDKQLEL